MTKIRIFISLLAVSLCAACAWFDFHPIVNESVGQDIGGTDEAVRRFLAGRTLAPIEGAWVHEGEEFEVVITRNSFAVAAGYEYVGIITRTDNPEWQQGDVKLRLRHTDLPDVFEGVWTSNNKSRTAMTFVFENRNLIQASYVSTDGNSYFVRIRRINPAFARGL